MLLLVLLFVLKLVIIIYKKKKKICANPFKFNRKVRQDVTDYKLELKISLRMLVNFEFRISIWNFELWLWISSFNFELRNLILDFEFWFWIFKFEVVLAPEACFQSKYWKFCMLQSEWYIFWLRNFKTFRRPSEQDFIQRRRQILHWPHYHHTEK